MTIQFCLTLWQPNRSFTNNMQQFKLNFHHCCACPMHGTYVISIYAVHWVHYGTFEYGKPIWNLSFDWLILETRKFNRYNNCSNAIFNGSPFSPTSVPFCIFNESKRNKICLWNVHEPNKWLKIAYFWWKVRDEERERVQSVIPISKK